jgi:hypothetical protein
VGGSYRCVTPTDKKEQTDKVPPNATLEFDIEVLTACQPIMKDVLVESESNVCAKEDDYVRIHMVVKGTDGAVRDDYFATRPLEFYMKDHVAQSDSNGNWRAGNLLKKLVEQMVLGEKAGFTVQEGIVDKYGNRPFWAKEPGPVVFELELKVIGKDEHVSGDAGVVKHKLREGEGYEKATDGAHLSFVYRIHSAPRSAGRVREAGAQGAADPPAAGGGAAPSGLAAVYDKWAKLDITEEGDVVEHLPERAEKALADADAAKSQQQSSVVE